MTSRRTSRGARSMSVAAVGALAIGAGVISAPVTSAAASELHVAVTGSDGPGCGAVASPCQTIQQALLNAGPGDTITVGAGRYEVPSGNLTIDKSITLRGPQAGVNPVGSATRAVGNQADEAVIRIVGDSNYVAVGINGVDEFVTIDGFTVEDSTVYRGCGLNQTGTLTVRNSILDGPGKSPAGGNARALWTACGDVVVEDNLIVGNRGYADSSAAYFAPANGTVTWTGNEVRDWTYEGLQVVYARDVVVRDNAFIDIDKAGVHLGQVAGVGNVIEDNLFRNANSVGDVANGGVKFGAIRLDTVCSSPALTQNCTEDHPVAFSIRGNSFDTALHALVTNVEPGVTGKTYTVDFTENKVEGVSGFVVVNGAPSTVSAQRNWWGAATDVPTLIQGQGVEFEPYYVSEDMTLLSDGTGGEPTGCVTLPDWLCDNAEEIAGSVAQLFGS